MKVRKTCIVFAILIIATFCFLNTSSARPKWKGSWYLRGADNCQEMMLKKKGQSDLTSRIQAVVEKRDSEYFLTIMSFDRNYTYRMIELADMPAYQLELISIGPNKTYFDKATPDRFTGMYRRAVDCQVMSWK